MSGSVPLCLETQNDSALASYESFMAAETHREAPFLSRKMLLSNQKRLIEQNSSSSLVLKEDERRLHLQKSSCMALEKIDSCAECRICQEEDELFNLETPCACTGSLKFAHKTCVQHWCNEKGDTICEICREPYEGGYTAPSLSSQSDSFSLEIGDSWEIASGQRFDLHDPRVFAVTSEHLFSQAEYEAYSRANERSAACFRSVALILLVVLLLRHVFSITSTGADEDASTFFMLFLLRTAGFFLPCYIIARALNVLQCRRQRREATLAAAEVAYLLQSGQGQGIRIAVSPGLLP